MWTRLILGLGVAALAVACKQKAEENLSQLPDIRFRNLPQNYCALTEILNGTACRVSSNPNRIQTDSNSSLPNAITFSRTSSDYTLFFQNPDIQTRMNHLDESLRTYLSSLNGLERIIEMMKIKALLGEQLNSSPQAPAFLAGNGHCDLRRMRVDANHQHAGRDPFAAVDASQGHTHEIIVTDAIMRSYRLNPATVRPSSCEAND